MEEFPNFKITGSTALGPEGTLHTETRAHHSLVRSYEVTVAHDSDGRTDYRWFVPSEAAAESVCDSLDAFSDRRYREVYLTRKDGKFVLWSPNGNWSCYGEGVEDLS